MSGNCSEIQSFDSAASCYLDEMNTLSLSEVRVYCFDLYDFRKDTFGESVLSKGKKTAFRFECFECVVSILFKTELRRISRTKTRSACQAISDIYLYLK